MADLKAEVSAFQAATALFLKDRELITRIHRQVENGDWSNLGQAVEAMNRSIWYSDKARRVGLPLFQTLLSEYGLPAKTRKGVEKWLRAWSKPGPSLAKKKPVDLLAWYVGQIGGMDEQLLLVDEALKSGKAHAEEGSATALKVGPFTLVNAGGFKPGVVQDMAKVMGKALALLGQSGFRSAAYGNVYMTNTVGPKNRLAFYQVGSDELYLRANLPDSTSGLYNVLHELGHRWQFKFLAKGVIEQLYSLVSGQDKNRKVDRLETVNRNYLDDASPNYEGFVTPYARTNPGENFAEMFAHYCLGDLPVAQSGLFEELVLGDGKVASAMARRLVARSLLLGAHGRDELGVRGGPSHLRRPQGCPDERAVPPRRHDELLVVQPGQAVAELVLVVPALLLPGPDLRPRAGLAQVVEQGLGPHLPLVAGHGWERGRVHVAETVGASHGPPYTDLSGCKGNHVILE